MVWPTMIPASALCFSVALLTPARLSETPGSGTERNGRRSLTQVPLNDMPLRWRLIDRTRLKENTGLPPYFFSYLLTNLSSNISTNCGDVEGLFRITQWCMFLKVRSHSSIAYSNFILTAELLSLQNPIFSDVPSPFGPSNDDLTLFGGYFEL
jgi:hypothetical protein